TNSGGAMPVVTVEALRAALPRAEVYLMYGLTEAFRSTYLPPAELARRPDSIGRAIPNAEVLVVRPDGTLCEADEPGELVHRGALVALGYWNDPARTAQRFRPAPGQDPALPLPELAVWSGDTVRRDADGYLYFVGRSDEMIKVSGYRISPTEVESVLHASGLVSEVAVFGIADETLGQAIVAVAVAD
ncbi:MAG TPA: acyl-CoA ligase (AMP-forming), exosortase A system-associated, partial [Massilia timonae]|nr:acyl-CoA ligase (AMP-forming), exosortase A system-associated [Massilia timonae]